MNTRGFTLIEVMVTIGITLGLAALVLLPLRTARAPLTATAATVTALLNQTRTLAMHNDGTGSGAMLVVRPVANGSLLTIVLNRPLRGFDAPVAAHHPPASIPLHLSIDGGNDTFTLAVAPNRQLDVIPTAITSGASAIDAAPGCTSNADNRLHVRVGDADHNETLSISCTQSLVVN